MPHLARFIRSDLVYIDIDRQLQSTEISVVLLHEHMWIEEGGSIHGMYCL